MGENLSNNASGKIVTVGTMLLIVGVVIAVGALTRETTVASTVDYSLPYTSALPSRLLNMGLLHEQMLWFVGGVACAVTGAVGIFVGKGVNAVVQAIRDGRLQDQSAAAIEDHFSRAANSLSEEVETKGAGTDWPDEGRDESEGIASDDSPTQVAHNQDQMVGWIIAAMAVMLVVIVLVVQGQH